MRVRAAPLGRSAQTEGGDLPAAAVRSGSDVLIGDALTAVSRRIGLTAEDFTVLESVRDRAPAKPLSLE